MNRDRLSPLSAALPVALCLLLAACGNKGDLFMPPPEPTVVDDVDQTAPAVDQDADDTPPPPPDPVSEPILDPAIEIRSDSDESEALPATESPVMPLPLPPPRDRREGEGGEEGS